MCYAGGQVRPPQAKPPEDAAPREQRQDKEKIERREEHIPGGGTRTIISNADQSLQIIQERDTNDVLRKEVQVSDTITTTKYYDEQGKLTLTTERRELEGDKVSIVKTYADGTIKNEVMTLAKEQEQHEQQREMLASAGALQHLGKQRFRHPRIFGDSKTAVTGPGKNKTEAPASSPPTPPATKKPEEKE